MLKKVPRNVLLLGLVSFFNDLASEMIYPLMPIFLISVLHTAIPVFGLIEGIAEATASITKFLFGFYSDYMQKRKIFVVGGYSLAAVSKLLTALAYSWPLVLFARFIDRLGKGMRSAARDSMLLDNTDKTNKGYIFGVHRTIETAGSIIGPFFALFLLVLLKGNIRFMFVIAFIPAVIGVLSLLFIREKKKENTEQSNTAKKYHWHLLDNRLKLFLLISFLFSVGNSSDSFLLLYAKNLGLTTVLVVLAYILYDVFQTIFSTPLGHLSDRIGPRKVFSGGLIVFSIVYFLFSIVHSTFWLWFLFPLYGIYIAATDGVSKAYISEFITKEESGTFFGAYYMLTAIGTFLASFIGGVLWSLINPSATFLYGSVMAISAFVIFFVFQRRFVKK